MIMDPLETATPVADPSEDEVRAPEPTGDGGQQTPPAVPQPTSQPDAAYKGLQRTLAREQARVRELESRLAQESGQAVDEQSDLVIRALIGEIAKVDPARGQALMTEYSRLQLARENAVLRNQTEVQQREQQLKEIEDRNIEELRAVVSAIGADPDAPEIDYGSSNEWFAERLKRARATAQEVVMAAKPAPRPRSQGDGTSHITQPVGNPPPPVRATNKVVTDEDVKAAHRKYTEAYQTNDATKRAAAEAELRAINEAYAKQVFA